ncbi:addiction module protein [candidate division KSB1 bacterium]|nr:addiction module protein [candidate division KSB1 bacterium]MBL7093686.1 addiction module protein [candidate division KSB1 bacterium]
MISQATLLKDALKLRPVEKAHLIEGLMASLEKPDPDVESEWEREALRRYKAYKQKRIKAKDLDEVLKKYE